MLYQGLARQYLGNCGCWHWVRLGDVHNGALACPCDRDAVAIEDLLQCAHELGLSRIKGHDIGHGIHNAAHKATVSEHLQVSQQGVHSRHTCPWESFVGAW